MAEDQVQFPVDGQECAIEDLTSIAQSAALADDHVLAEILRLAPYAGSGIAKAVLPYGPAPGVISGTAPSYAFVQPNGATGTVRVMPFRAVVGSRSLIAASTTNNWRDIRSVVYAVSDDGTTLGHAVSIASNSSGSTRIDTVYAQVAVGVPGASAPRIVKPVAGGTTVPTTLVSTTTQTVTILVAQGTSTTPPTLPVDSLIAGTFNIPLAHVFVANGFNTASSSVASAQIQEVAPTVPMGANRPLGLVGASPMECVTRAPTNSAFATWAANSKVYTPWMLPTTMQGAMLKWFGASREAGLSGSSIDDTGAIDASMDWRYRNFLVFVQCASGSGRFAYSSGVSTFGYVPQAFGAASGMDIQHGQSFQIDDNNLMGITTRNGATIYYADSTKLGAMSGAKAVGLYVDMTTGVLRIYHNWVAQSFNGYAHFWILATGQMSNPT